MSRRKDRRCRCGDRAAYGALSCAACSHAASPLHLSTPGRSGLPVECYCRDTTVWCPPSFIKAGLSRSCGLPSCGPEIVAA